MRIDALGASPPRTQVICGLRKKHGMTVHSFLVSTRTRFRSLRLSFRVWAGNELETMIG